MNRSDPMSTCQPPSTTTQAPRADAEAIDWDNVAVETAVMLRLQQAPPVASARQGKPQAKG
jgi:electron transfer flavoprotein alpha/beta subunit